MQIASLYESDFWTVWRAAERLLPDGLTPAFRHGMTGESLRSRQTSLVYSDLTHWLLPGLRCCGIRAELTPLPSDNHDCLMLLHRQLRQNHSVPVFAFSPPAALKRQADANNVEDHAGNEEETENEVITALASDLVLHRQGSVVLVDMDLKTITVEEDSGQAQVWEWEAFRAQFTHLVTLQRQAARGRRPAHVHTAIATWAMFACACPHRLISLGAEETKGRLSAAEFWLHLAGADRSRVSNSLRRIASLLTTAHSSEELNAVWRLLYELACRQSLLPDDVIAALLAPSDDFLTDAERRELIYYVRAGTRDIKILAAHRLSAERDNPDARQTLEQLRYDADPWVRAMAGQ